MINLRLNKGIIFAINAKARIEGVMRILESLEEFFPHARDQAFLRTQQMLAKASSTGDEEEVEEIELEIDLMKIEWKGRFPACFYGSLVVLVWSEFEAIIEQFAQEIQEEKKVSLAFNDIAGSSTYSRLRKYIEAVLGKTLPENSAIEDLQFLRNTYAHHGGEISAQSKKRKDRIEAIVRSRNSGVSLEEVYPPIGIRFKSGPEAYVIVNADYIKRSITGLLLLIDSLGRMHPSNE